MLESVHNFNIEACLIKNAMKIIGSFHVFQLTSMDFQNIKHVKRVTSLCIIGSSFIHLIRTDSNVFFLMAE